ncbi:sugar-binding transcriptional regulator [Psychromonas aquimarina]|uniref:sugar-binding transcriptional regulator n=1 Tax=Psychromonas aquimarina TaxID=444919 RepID=UPI00040EC877|nr:sugar-binding transcriptional regulator [Psychromonas aquimarina]
MKESNSKIDSIVRAAWLYYVSGANQSEVAAALGVSRPAAQRMIAAAKDEGIISIGINHPIASCLEYEGLLKDKFKLQLCHIVPNGKYSETDEETSLSYGGAQVISQYISQETPIKIGLGSGKTLKKAINYLEKIDRPQHKCVALISAMDSEGLCNYYDDVPLLFASKIKARYYQLPAPRYSNNQEDYNMWCNNPLYQNITTKADNADVIFIGIGSIGDKSPIVQDRFIDNEKSESLRKIGVVGEILGRFIDEQGSGVDHKINKSVTSYDVRNNKKQNVIAIASGSEKQAAILAALKGKWLNGLVTDEQTARWLLTN